MPSGTKLVGAAVVVALVVSLGLHVILPSAEEAQGRHNVTLEHGEDETREIYQTLEGNVTNIDTVGASLVGTIHVTNTKTGRSDSSDVIEGDTETLSIGDIEVVVEALDYDTGPDVATVSYRFERDAFLDGPSKAVVRLLVLLVLLGGLLLLASVVVGVHDA